MFPLMNRREVHPPRHARSLASPRTLAPNSRLACLATRMAPLLLLILHFACGSAGAPQELLMEFTGHKNGDLLGMALTSAGDLNGDGVPDLLVSASQMGALQAQPGYVLALSGSDGARLLRLDGASGGDAFGRSVASVADVDGDGVRDIAVGAPGADLRGPEAGAVHLYSGRSGTPLWVSQGDRGGDALGVALCALGDVDGDGTPDLAAAALQPAQGPTNDPGFGYVRALSGADGSPLFTARGSAEASDLGRLLAPLGDINGDGLPDLAASAPPSQAVLFLSGRTGATLLRLDGRGAGFGEALASFPDLNGDGLPELAVGAPLDSNAAPLGGAVHIIHGRDGTNLLIARGLERGLRLGSQVASVADLDGDGRAELAATPGGGGHVRLLSSSDGRELRRLEAHPDQHSYGLGLAALGDLDGDGRPELAVGSPDLGQATATPGGVHVLALRP